MAINNHIKNVTIVGASGNVGSSALKHLLATGNFDITVVSRATSSATLTSDPSVTIKKGAYDDAEFVANVFQGQDVVIFTLGFMAMEQQSTLIEAAAKAGVKWIIPTEYAGDGQNEAMMKAVPLFYPKVAARKQIEKLAKTYEGLKWIGVATNPWIEFSLQRGMFGIEMTSHAAKLYKDAGAFNTSTLPQVGLGISKLLSLPITNDQKPRASLQHYANNFVYISSFLVTQAELLSAVQRASGTKESDWQVDRDATIQDAIAVAREKMAKGDMFAGAGLTYAYYMGEGLGGNVEEKARQDRKVLGLPQENLDEVVKQVVERGDLPKVVPKTN